MVPWTLLIPWTRLAYWRWGWVGSPRGVVPLDDQTQSILVKGMVRNARRPDQGVESTAAPDTEAVSTEPAVDEPPPPPAGVRPSEPDGGVVEVGEAEATQSLPATEERGKLAQTRPASGSGGERGGEGDPSLRELFWGEED